MPACALAKSEHTKVDEDPLPLDSIAIAYYIAERCADVRSEDVSGVLVLGRVISITLTETALRAKKSVEELKYNGYVIRVRDVPRFRTITLADGTAVPITVV